MDIFAKATPESCGISSQSIIDFIERLGHTFDNQETHSFLLIRHGKLACEAYYSPYSENMTHTLFSVSKSFTSLAIGLLAEEGRLNVEDYIHSYFPELVYEDINKENLKIRIHDLLSMSFGQQGGAVHENQKRTNESGAMLYDFFYRNKDIDCGKEFRYDSYGTYMLAALVKKLTGENVVEYLMPRLFEPLGIEKPHYIQDEIGNNIGYTGMKMTLRDLAKVGMVFLNGGKWQEKQLIPKAWIDVATSKQTPSENCGTGVDWQQGYCYQLWRGRHNTSRLCGAFGQMCVIMPDYDAILVINSGYDNDKLWYILDSFYDTIMLNMKPHALDENPEKLDKLRDVISSLAINYRFSTMSPLAKIISGNTYDIDPKGSYTAVKMEFEEDKVDVTLVSEEDEYGFTAGFSAPVFGRIEGTHFAALDKVDSYDTAATAAWINHKELEITLRLLGSPSIVRVVADFSQDKPVRIVTSRCKF